MVAATGFLAAPLAFATLPRADAGRLAARLFGADAAIGLGVGALLLVLALHDARALIGKSAGDVAEVRAPAGVREYEILDIKYI